MHVVRVLYELEIKTLLSLGTTGKNESQIIIDDCDSNGLMKPAICDRRNVGKKNLSRVTALACAQAFVSYFRAKSENRLHSTNTWRHIPIKRPLRGFPPIRLVASVVFTNFLADFFFFFCK